jgi:hypothetical protein
VPPSRKPGLYMHIFLDAGGGNVLAFFELPTKLEMGRDPNTPAWVQHIAFKVRDRATLLEYREHLEKNGVEGLGATGNGSGGLGVQPDPEGSCHLEDRGEAWIPIGAQRAVQTFPAEAGLPGDL